MPRLPAVLKYGLQFNGSSSYSSIAAGAFSGSDYNGAMSIGFWLFATPVSSSAPLFDNEWGTSNNVGGWQFYVTSTGFITGITFGTTNSTANKCDSIAKFPKGIWVHVMLTQLTSSTRQTLYLNAIKDKQILTATQTTTPPTLETDIGTGRRGGSPPYCNCQMADIVMYNRELSASEVAQVMVSNYPTSGLIHHWDFHEGSGGTVSDIVGGINFTNQSSPSWITAFSARSLSGVRSVAGARTKVTSPARTLVT